MCENQTEQNSTLLYFEDFVLLLRFIYKDHVKVNKQLSLRTSFAYCDQFHFESYRFILFSYFSRKHLIPFTP